MVAKLRDAPYRGTRTGDWLKIKRPLTKPFVIGGYSDPDGTRTHFGALLLGQYESDGALRYTDKVGTGFNQEKLRKIHAMLEARAQPDRRPFANPPRENPRLKRTRISYGQNWSARFASPNGPTAAASANPVFWAWSRTPIRANASTTGPARTLRRRTMRGMTSLPVRIGTATRK